MSSRRHHPVVLVEGKVRHRCETIERETIALREKLVSLRATFEAERHAHLREVDEAGTCARKVDERTLEAMEATRTAMDTRDEQTAAMSSLLADFRRMDGKRAALSQKVTATEAAVLTLQGRLDEATSAIAELDLTCAKENDLSAEHDWETHKDLESMKESRRAAEFSVVETREQAAAERAQLTKSLNTAKDALQDARDQLVRDREALEKKRGKQQDLLERKEAAHRQKMTVFGHERTVLGAKLAQIELLNQKLETRLELNT
ncbi:unnamed protein product [Amoebophrya sp. A120]|nr:unnamed protein product [Amoebophrya sp. A120]|eukprot:GSA120T00012814001.1